MNKADKMFRVLGYKIEEENAETIVYRKGVISKISMNKTQKTYSANRTASIVVPMVINFEIHQALNEKMKELGWFE